MRSPGRTQPCRGARGGSGGGRHPGRATRTGPAAPGSGARRASSQRASSRGAGAGTREAVVCSGRRCSAPSPGECRLGAGGEGGDNFVGNLRGSSAARARAVETDAGQSGQTGSRRPEGTATLANPAGVVEPGAEETRRDGPGRQTGRGREGRTRAESPRRLSLGSRSSARLGTVPGRGRLDCPVQLLQVEAGCWGKEPGGART